MKKLRLLLLCVMMTIVTLVQSIPVLADAGGSAAAGTLNIPKTVTIQVGETVTIDITGKPAVSTYVYNAEYQYNPNYVETDVKGFGTYWGKPGKVELKGKCPGESDLLVTIEVFRKKSPDTQVGTVTRRCKVKVVAKKSSSSKTTKKNIPLKNITLNKSTVNLKAGQTTTLKVSFVPSNTTASKKVEWYSNNTAVATVDKTKGTITAKRIGTAIITARAGTKIATCKIIVGKAQTAAKNTNTQKKTTNTGKTNKDRYCDVKQAYSILEKFRRTKNVWYWNSDNKTKTVLNTESKKLCALKRDPKLEATAKVRAKELASLFGHTRPNGKRCFDAYPPMWAMGENIAMGYKDCTSVMNGWIEADKKYNGQGHRRNMLNAKFNAVGIACYEHNGVKYWAMCLGGK